MRTLEQIEQSFIAALAKENSPVDDLSPGSVLNALIRSISTLVLEQENRLDELRQSLNPLTAKGGYLDEYAQAMFNLARKDGTLARGTVLLSTSSEANLAVPKATILTEINTALQFITVEDSVVSNVADAITNVVSATLGEENNLPAGTTLYANNFPNISFTVGFERRPDGTVCGNLSGGQTQESDILLRQRVAEYRNGLGPTLESTILSYLLIDYAWVKTRAPGFVHVYLDMDGEVTEDFQEELRDLVAPFLSPGTFITFEKITLRPIDINLQIIPLTNTNPDEQIRLALQKYFGSVEPGSLITPLEITSVVQPYVSGLSLVAPSTSVQMLPQQIPSISDLYICYSRTLD